MLPLSPETSKIRLITCAMSSASRNWVKARRVLNSDFWLGARLLGTVAFRGSSGSRASIFHDTRLATRAGQRWFANPMPSALEGWTGNPSLVSVSFKACPPAVCCAAATTPRCKVALREGGTATHIVYCSTLDREPGTTVCSPLHLTRHCQGWPVGQRQPLFALPLLGPFPSPSWKKFPDLAAGPAQLIRSAWYYTCTE